MVDWNGCNNCKHLKRDKKKGYICEAYPNGIPMMFLSGEMPHTKVFQGQNGKTVWEAKE